MLGALGPGLVLLPAPAGGNALPQKSGLRLSPSAPSGAQDLGAGQASCRRVSRPSGDLGLRGVGAGTLALCQAWLMAGAAVSPEGLCLSQALELPTTGQQRPSTLASHTDQPMPMH